ncbi:DsbA family oxidoreductase [Chitinophaga filiformis]|uniref:DsbA family oxidoreductase n=1 Tax=Chitinophaga filiformis TaxID=104663 RepID=A0ABY4I929_CHIFI|nr:DsbA family oxidoreductase [Chitinophaga filiformis]UPK72603.1 DsbA family oxidoreductase [Chitinophaga filiformis]
MSTTNKMKVEIWSDIMCPWCYIGKRRFEAAMAQFPDAGAVEIEWHSFQLDPTIQSGHGDNLYAYLSKRKGIPYEQAEQMNNQVTALAGSLGLTYNLDQAVVANSFDAHRLIQLAKKHQLGDAAEERLFRAYFTEGKDFSDPATLVALGKEIGLEESVLQELVSGQAYAAEVRQDIAEAEALGVRGVPFFVFDRKYGVSGAQAAETFLEVLNKSVGEWKKTQPSGLEIVEGQTCGPDGDC